MKYFITAVIVVATATVAYATGIPGVAAGTKRFTLNNNVGRNAIEFVSDAPAETINGTSEGVTGTFAMDAQNLEGTTGSIDVAVMSMKTANSKRDEHMYDAMWLDAGKYPAISFAVKSLKDVKVVAKDGRNVVTAKAIGTFTCHGVSVASAADITITYLPESAETKKRATGNLAMIEATFNVKLAEHGIKGKAGVVGKSVGEVIAIKAKLFANS